MRRGLTLAELVVVLLILAVLTTVAVQSLAPVVEQSRFEATQRTLTNVRSAILSSSQSSGSASLSGFLADTGRLPASLDELLIQPPDLPAYGLHPAPGPPTTSASDSFFVPCGWRGPYLQLPIGANRVLDGWGAPLAIDTSDPNRLAIASLAAHRPSNTAYPNDFETTVQTTDWQVLEVKGTLYSYNSADGTRNPPNYNSLIVWLLGPGPIDTNNGVMAISTAAVGPNPQVTYSFTFSQPIAAGPRSMYLTRADGGHVGPINVTLRPGSNVIDIQAE